MKLVAMALFVLALGASQEAVANSERLANYFVCSLNEGKTRSDLMAFKTSYEAAVAEAGLDGYELRVQFPIYWGERGRCLRLGGVLEGLRSDGSHLKVVSRIGLAREVSGNDVMRGEFALASSRLAEECHVVATQCPRFEGTRSPLRPA